MFIPIDNLLSAVIRRCTLIEPGPVDTPMIHTVFDVADGVDNSTADRKTRLIKERVDARFGEFWAEPENILSAQQVAEVIKEVILSENPNFRYQPNKYYCPDEITAKLADITGNKSIDLITKRFCAE